MSNVVGFKGKVSVTRKYVPSFPYFSLVPFSYDICKLLGSCDSPTNKALLENNGNEICFIVCSDW